MTAMTLTNSRLERLSLEALVAFYDQAAGFEAHLTPGCSLVLSGEPVADLNYLLAGRKATVEGFVAGARKCLERELPFLSILFPDVAEMLAGPAAELGLQHAVEFPFMVATAAPPDVDLGDLTVRRAVGEEGARASAQALHGAFKMPVESMLRAMPADALDGPALEVWIAELDATCVGAVTLTFQGDTAGVWAMGVDPQVQRKGVGRRLLTTAMREAATRGVRRFYLGATPAGKPLYERLGFATQLVTQVWASGESGQT
jgi:GNAT superfamily N-acetyltransferase